MTGSADGNVVTVFGGCGGVGKTAVATNLASLWAADGLAVVLIDADFQLGGSIGPLFELEGATDFFDLDAALGTIKPELISRCLAMDERTRIHVLLAPATLRKQVRPATVESIVSLLKGSFDAVVVDLPATIDAVSAAFQRLADVNLLVTVPDRICWRRTRRYADLLQVAGVSRDRCHTVVNRVSIRDWSQYQGLARLHVLPEEARLVQASRESGTPVVLHQPYSLLALAFRRLKKALPLAVTSPLPAVAEREAKGLR